jgi:hypothetical protein
MAVANGWTSSTSYTNVYPWISNVGNTVYRMTRNKSDGGSYVVYINSSLSSTNGPEIYSIGCANWNQGQTTATNAVRKVYIQTTAFSQLGNDGLIAYSLTFNGNNVTIDSFDSSTSAHSIWHSNLWWHGMNYGTWTNTLSYNSNAVPSRTANVHVAAETNFISVGNANIYGFIDTSPGGTYNIKNQGSVGDLDWVHNGNSGLQSGHFKDDMNQTYSSGSAPSSFSNAYQLNNWLRVATGAAATTNIIKIGGVWTNIAGTWVDQGGILYSNKNNAGWVLPGGDGNNYTYTSVITNRPLDTNGISIPNNIYYAMGSIGSGNLFVDAQYAILYVTNGIDSPVLTINTNADVYIYSQSDVTFGNTVNSTALARACTISDIVGHPITVTASGNASGVSKILVPASTLKFNGGGNNTYDIIGEIIGNDVTFDGHFNLHYDESLRSSSPSSQFIATVWKEVY